MDPAMNSQIKSNSLSSYSQPRADRGSYSITTPLPRSTSTMNNQAYEGSTDINSLYSTYSPPCYDPPASSGIAAPVQLFPNSTINKQANEGHMEGNSLYSIYSPPRSYTDPKTYDSLYSNYSQGASNQIFPAEESDYQALPPELDMDTQAALLAQQLGNSHIDEGYTRVPSFNPTGFNHRDYYKNHQSFPGPASGTVRDLDAYGSGLPVNYPYEPKIGTTNYSLYGSSHVPNHDHQVQRNPSFSGRNEFVYPYESKLATSSYANHGRSSYGHEDDQYGGLHQNPKFAGSNVAVNHRYPSTQNDYAFSSGNSTTTMKLNHEAERDTFSFLSLLQETIRGGDVFDIMKDKHGNYTFQNFLKLCDEGQKEEIVTRVSEDPKRLMEVAIHQIGRVSFRKLIAAVKTSPQLCDHLMNALSPGLCDLMNHSNGPPMIEYLLCHLGPDHKWHIFKVALEHFSSLSRSQKGVFSLNHCIRELFKFDDEETKATTKYRTLIWMEVIKNSVELATDTFGNYVVQTLMDLKIGALTILLCNNLKDHVQVLSQSKPGSYVMQSCLKSSAGHIILDALVTCEPQILHEITMHPFGNYVMQTAMNILKDKPVHQKLVQAINKLPKDFNYHINARNVMNNK